MQFHQSNVHRCISQCKFSRFIFALYTITGFEVSRSGLYYRTNIPLIIYSIFFCSSSKPKVVPSSEAESAMESVPGAKHKE